MAARTLLYDLEITPMLGYAYEEYDARIIRVERPAYIMCFAYMWYGEGTRSIRCVAQPDFKRYKREPYSDLDVVRELHSLLDEADIVVAHNASKFDNRVSMGRFLFHGMTPPSPFRTVDTLTVARKRFRFSANSLNRLGEHLGLGEKTKVRHHDLWPDCVAGDLTAWAKMTRYCKRDVALLHDLYERELPYIPNHPNVALIGGRGDACPHCGSDKMQHRGKRYTNSSVFRRLQCQSCGGWSSERLPDGKKAELVSL